MVTKNKIYIFTRRRMHRGSIRVQQVRLAFMSKASVAILLLLCSLAPSIDAAAAGSCNPRDEEALLAFKNGDEQRKGRLSSWEQGTGCCQWQGVSCTMGGRVTVVNLTSSELYGQLSPQLAALGELQVLDLSNNGLDGSIPSSFGESLLKLRVLNLGNNFMSGQLHASLEKLSSSLRVLDLTTYRFEGPLSPVIGKLFGLQQLRLVRSDVRDSIPSFLGNLHNLTHLDLSGSDFSGSVPASISQLSQLQFLDLSNCVRLTGSIPASLGKLGNLEWLSLIGTSISGSIPSSFAGLTKLKFLQLSCPNLSGTIPAALGELVSLETLAIASTKVTGRIPEFLGALKHLKSLDLSGNAAMRGPIPLSLGQLTALETLELASSGLTGTIPSNLGGLGNLVRLSLSSNALTGTIPESLGLLENLQYLLAFDNNLSGRIPEGFSRKLRKLSLLQLGNNSITGLPSSMKSMVKLEAVYMGTNRLSFEAISGLATLPRLFTLSLSNCGLKGPIPKWLQDMDFNSHGDSEGFLDLSFNTITGSIPSSFGRSSLSRLFLQSNKLTGTLPATFAQAKKLLSLDISSNALTALPARLDNLGVEDFRLDNNKLSFSSISGLATLPHVSILKLDSSGLEGPIPSWLFKIRMVPELGERSAMLSMSSNRISGSIPPEVDRLTNLTILNLDNNQLSGPIPSSLSKLTSLRAVDLSRNRLTGGIPTELLQLKDLQYFNVSSNQLKGPIPQQPPFNAMDAASFTNNPGLCGKPLTPC